MQPQSTKNIYNGPPKTINKTTQARNMQQSFSNSVPRNRYIQTAAIFPPLPPGMVMSQFNATAFTPRPPNPQQCQYPAQFYPQLYYPYYVPQLPQQQQPSVNANSIIGAMPLQPGSFAATGNHTALTFAVTPNNSLLNVANSPANQTLGVAPLQQTPAQISYGFNNIPSSCTLSAPTVSSTSTHMTFATAALSGNNRIAPPTAVAGMPPTQPQIKGKLRSHALQIINPLTNQNILQELNNDKEISFPPIAAATSQTQFVEEKSAETVLNQEYKKNEECVRKDSVAAVKRNYKDATQQAEQLTIVTARTHDACVEIVPHSKELLATALDEVVKETPVKPQHLLEKFQQKSNELSTENQAECVATNSKEIETETELTEVVKENPVEKEKEAEVENFQSFQAAEQSSALVEREYVQEVYDDAKSYTDTSLVLEDQAALIRDQEVSENVNPCTDSEETEAESLNQETLMDYNEHPAMTSGPTVRKQYTRKQLMQLRQSKQSCMQPEVCTNCTIFAPLNLMPAFVARNHKNVNIMPAPARGNDNGYINYQNNYIKQSSRTNRGSNNAAGSIVTATMPAHHQHNRNKGKPLIYLNLSLNQDVELNEADNAWKPRVLNIAADVTNLNKPAEKEELLRRVRGILNKLTPEKFEPLVEQIIKLKIDTMDKMEAVMNLVFEKAIDEPNFSFSYAKLCQRLISEVKASDERMQSSTKTNLAYFRNALLNKTQEEFTNHVTKINAKEEKLKPLKEKYDNCVDSNEKIELKALLSEEERKIRKRSGGTVRFIGELFQISILSGNIINNCIHTLVKDPCNEDMLECLCKLLTTVGEKFEQTCLSLQDERKYSLKTVIQRMQNIAGKTENNKISSRVRFMLQDVIDLRKKKWQTTRNETPKTMQQIEKEINKNTNTESLTNNLQQSRKMMKAEHTAGGVKRAERCQAGFSEGKLNLKETKRLQLPNNRHANKSQLNTGLQSSTQAVDTSKLVGLTKVDMNNKKMGDVSLFQWQKSAGNSFAALEANKTKNFQQLEHERNRPGSQAKSQQNKATLARENCVKKEANYRNNQHYECKQKSHYQTKYHDEMDTLTSREFSCPTSKNVLKEPNNEDLKLIKSVVNEILENFATSKSIDSDTVSCIKRLPHTLRCSLIYYILTDYLHLANVKTLKRRHLAQVVIYLLEHKYLTYEQFHVAYSNFAIIASDLIVDIPELWLYIFEFTGPLLVKNLLSVHDLWHEQLRETAEPAFKKKFLKSLLIYSTREIGPCFTRNLWQKHGMKWCDFMAETEVYQFISSQQFEFIEDANKPVNIMMQFKESAEALQKRVKQHIQQLLRENCQPYEIIDYINGNIALADRSFINNLSNILINFALNDMPSYSLDLEKFQKVCLPILRCYLNSQQDLELECLDAVYNQIQKLESPKDLWLKIYADLNQANIITPETFNKWQNSKSESNNCL